MEKKMDEHVSESTEQNFKVDNTAQSLTKMFEQMASYDTLLGFLYSIKDLKSIEQGKLFLNCKDLEATLSFENQRDINRNELFTEMKVLCEFSPAEVETAAGVFRIYEQN